MIEAELKARVRNPEYVMEKLDQEAEGRDEIYQDTYYDDPSGSLSAQDQELRVRTIHRSDSTRSVLTYKGARIDAESGSKPEHETGVDDAEAVHAMLRGLGYVPVIAFQKRCRHHEFSAHGRCLLASLIHVPEIEGTFLEVETLVCEEKELPAALDAIRSIMGELGIRDKDLTTELYTDAVAARRTPGAGAVPPA
ncbi:class IV adenylate cyclase [Streptomyces noursei]|uniref:class IV adenylate cyclase n=1 Tax=Streptomyces noursei TaxID=1971 RepID=UPI0016792772|nr:class IV adenylate cyclase [Streptomyces noursei]MCZ1016429.1 class IV adenylate cyclase [Streptomyces noursei]GGW99713.1 adenylate cyclase [Streptomyces noursei]